MRHVVLCTAVLLSFASSCGGDNTTPDAKLFMDGSGSGTGSGSGSAAFCTGALYDPCVSFADCTGGTYCTSFEGFSVSVCTMACTGTCFGNATCTSQLRCQPAAPNNCTPR